jgi:hypothetical protein
MNIIKEQDVEKLSQEDLGLLLDYIKGKESLVQSLHNHDQKSNDHKLKLATLLTFDSAMLYEKRRNGLNVITEIINSLTLFEYCSRIWEDYFKILEGQKGNRFSYFENQYQLLRKSGKDHNSTINQLVIEEEKEQQANNLNLAFEIGSIRLLEVSKNIEKYSALLSDTKLKLSLEKPRLEFDYESISLKYPSDIENHLRFLENGIIDDHEKLFGSFLEQNAFKIMKATLWNELTNEVKNYEEPVSNIRAEEITLNRQVMAVYCLLRTLGVTQIDNTKIAEFIQFITKKNMNYGRIKDTEIYNKLRLKEISKKDEEFLKREFEKIGLQFKI